MDIGTDNFMDGFIGVVVSVSEGQPCARTKDGRVVALFGSEKAPERTCVELGKEVAIHQIEQVGLDCFGSADWELAN